MAKVTYHKSHTFITNDDKEHTFVTQLYQTGIYGIVNNDPGRQGNFTPQAIVKLEKNLEKAVKDKKIKSFELGIPITVTDKSGFWEEVIEEEVIDYPKSHTEDIKAVRGQGKTRKVVTIKAKKAFEQWGCEFFVHLTMMQKNGFSNNYSITEKFTGLSIVNGESSEKKAIKSAKNMLEDKGEKLFMEKVEEFKLENYAKD